MDITFLRGGGVKLTRDFSRLKPSARHVLGIEARDASGRSHFRNGWDSSTLFRERNDMYRDLGFSRGVP